jgi:hypothetical protein
MHTPEKEIGLPIRGIKDKKITKKRKNIIQSNLG